MDVSCGCDDEVIVGKLARVKADGDFVVETGYGFPRAFDWTPERLIGEISRIEKFSQELVGGVLDHFHLFENHFLLAFEIFLFETGMRNEVGEQIYRLRYGGVRNLCGEARHLMGRISIQVSPKPVSLNGNIASAPVLRTLKDGVLDKMANSVEFGGLVTRSTADPNAGRDGSEPRHMFRQDGYPVREFCGFNLVYHLV